MGHLGHLGMVPSLLPTGQSRELLTLSQFIHTLHTQYSPYLRNYATTLGTVSFAKVGNAGDAAVDTFRKIWNVATGQDV